MKRRVLPDIICLALIAAVCCLFFHRLILHPEELYWSDNSDSRMFYPREEFKVRQLRETGEFPLWDASQFAGTPLQANVQADSFYPLNVIFFIIPGPRAMSWCYAVQMFLAGVFFFLWMRYIGLNRAASLGGALVFMLSARFVALSHIGHYGHICTLTWLPLCFLFVEMLIRKRKIYAAVLLAAATSIMFFAGHTQYYLYGIAALGLYLVVRFLSLIFSSAEGRRKTAGVIVALAMGGLALHILLISVQLLPSAELSRYVGEGGRRDLEYAEAGGMRAGYFLTYLLPNAFGNAANEYSIAFVIDDSSLPHEISVFVGVLALVLAGAAFAGKDNGIAKALAVVAIVFAIISLGLFTGVLVDAFPRLSLFRVQMRSLAITTLCLAGLAAIGIQKISTALKEKNFRPAKIFGITALAASLVFFAAALFFKSNPSVLQRMYRDEAVKSYFAANARAQNGSAQAVLAITETLSDQLVCDLLRAGAALGIGGALLLAGAFARRAGALVTWLLVLTIFAELFANASRFTGTVPESRVFPPAGKAMRVAAGFNESRACTYEVFDETTAKSLGLETIATGVDSTILGRYERVVFEAFERGEFLREPPPNMMKAHRRAVWKGREPILNMLNVRLVGTRTPIELPGFELIYRAEATRDGRDVLLYENHNALPRAYFVPRAEVAADVNELKARLRRVDLKKTVILEEAPKGVRMKNPGGFVEATIVERRPNKITVRVSTDGDGFLVLSEIWYPGWKAREIGENGKRELEIYRANGVLRAVCLGGGEHNIEFAFEPDSLKTGATLSLLGALLIAIYAACLAVLKIRAIFARQGEITT